MPTHRRILAAVVAMLLAGAGLLLLVGPSPAAAHAILESTDPAAGAVLTTAPTAVTLTFDEPVEISLGALRLFDGFGKSVDVGTASHPGGHSNEVGIALPKLGNGSYVVDWRVVSADSHPVQGAYTFQVGPSSNLQPGILDSIIGSDHTGRPAGIALAFSRGLLIAAMAIVFGGLAAFAAGVVQPVGRVRLVVLVAALAGGFVGLLQLPLEVGYATGRSLTVIGDSDAWSAAFDSRVGVAWLIRALIVAVVGFALVSFAESHPRLWWRTLGLAGLIGIGLASAFSGHGDTGRWHVVGVAATVVHVAAISIWLGALLAVLVGFAQVDAASMRRFSALAFSMVALVLVSGVVQSIRQVGSIDALTGTTYGTLLIWKVGLVVLTLVVAALNRRIVHRDELDRPRLRRSVTIEVVLTAAIVAATSLLMAANPSQAAASKPFSATLFDNGYLASITVEPGHVGANEMHIYLSSADSSLTEPSSVVVQISDPTRGVAAIDIPVTRSGAGHYTTPQATFPYATTWTLSVTAVYNTFDEVAFTAKVPVR